MEIKPLDPILIKSGYEAVDGTKMAFITTNRSGESEVFLPGSSLKGVFRSYFEKICRTLIPESPTIVCFPYKEYSQNETEVFCGAMFQHRRDIEKNKNLSKDIVEDITAGKSENVYRYSCPACRMFGSTYFIGRCSISDSYLSKPVKPEVRPGVAIDRHCGKVAQGPFDYQALTNGVFETTISIRNFELWMLGAWAYLLKDLEDHLIRIGAHKSRGMGRIDAKVKRMTLTYYKDPKQKVQGIGEMVTEAESQSYGLHNSDIPLMDLMVNADIRGVRRVYDITNLYSELLPNIANVFNHYIENLKWWQPIHQYANGRG